MRAASLTASPSSTATRLPFSSVWNDSSCWKSFASVATASERCSADKFQRLGRGGVQVSFYFLGQEFYLDGAPLDAADAVQVLAEVTPAELQELALPLVQIALALVLGVKLVFSQVISHGLVFRVGALQVKN